MAARRRHWELSVERPLDARLGTSARLSVAFEPGADGSGPSAEEIGRTLEELLRGLDAAAGSGTPGAAERPDRELRELVETYRPRQRELVDVLLADGELTRGEHAVLLASLGREPLSPPVAPSPEPPAVGETPIAAVPIAAEPRLPPARAVPELLRTFQITSLRQAGAVRARRQISFAEYMALKRHFEASGAPDGKEPAPPAERT